ncbi:MAG: hypothetical protein NT062_11070 [Proteobacteria bacterium]|nr:hypothetical protein [Pseudomonadota bacterium]
MHAALMSIARRRGALDAEEARLLRRAEDVQIWLRFGMVSPLDYLERKLGYAPHTANERLRVASALADLPEMERALETGELCFSAVRELTRVATEDGEAAWITWAAGKSVREIEQKVATHDPGDLPTDLGKPVEAQSHRVSIELPPETYARWRQAIAILSDEHGRRLDLPSFVGALLDAALDQKVADGDLGRARYQIAITRCAECRQATQEGGGVQVAIGPDALACASCDAVEIGSIDGDGPDGQLATQTIPPRIRRFVMHRDGRKCRVPGCRSAKHLDVHHLHHREHGGDHEPSLLVTMCGSCHAAHHRGDLIVRGTAQDLVVERPNDPDVRARRSHVGSPTRGEREDAKLALVTLGFTPALARDALARVPDVPARSLE